MKIDVNYELISKIGEAKTGFNVRRVGHKFSFLTGVLSLAVLMMNQDDPKGFGGDMLYSLSVISLQTFGMELISRNSNKRGADEQLGKLSSRLNDIGVFTNQQLLMDAELYKTKYKLEFNKGLIPRILQSKYIMVPTHNQGEISLVQEHVVGKRNFDISVGEPQKKKQYKLAYNGI